MLQDIPFEIRQNNKILYKGTLDAAELAKARSLGNFKSGQKGSLEFMLTIPKEWDNAYALKKTDVTWIFAVSEEEKETPDLSKDKEVGNTSGKVANAKDTQAQRKHPVKTGDESEPLLLFLLLLGSGAIVLTIRIFKGGQET